MHFNEETFSTVCEGSSFMEGRLNYQKAGGNRGKPGFKERWFKLRLNVLFYYKLSEAGNVIDKKPCGALVLENCSAVVERLPETPFTFSITFKDDVNKKHLFSARSEENVTKWITHLNSASYEFLRKKLKMLQNRLSVYTGQDPLLFYRSECPKSPTSTDCGTINDVKSDQKVLKAPTFRSYVNKGELSFVDEYFGNSLTAISSTAAGNITDITMPRPQPVRKAPDPPARPLRGQKVPLANPQNLIDL